MLRTFACAAVALSLAASAFAGELNDPNNRFRITVPDGWTTEPKPDIDIVALIVGSPRKAETRGNCNVVIAPNQLTGLTQEQIDQQLSAVVSADFWKATLAKVKEIKSTTIDDWGIREQRGRKVYYVKATSEASAIASLFVTQLMDLYTMPGQSFAVTCTARKEFFEREAADFAAIMASFEPLPDLTVASVRMPRMPVSPRTIAAQVTIDSAAAGVARALRH
ncbi:MAG: hypothetical protein ABL996_05775 [Micropepsaceae bacterium]